MNDRITSLLNELPAVDADAEAAVRGRAEQVLRPTGALQRLDDIAVHMAGWQATSRPTADQPAVLVFAADHGVAAAGVSNYPTDVTAAMLAAVRAGKATVNAFARAAGASVVVSDVGVGDPTGDIRTTSAVTPERLDRVAQIAIAAVDECAANGTDVIALGELGIGNTTISAALPAALLGGDAARWVGRGTGVDDDGLARKRDAVEAAVRRIAGIIDPIEVLREVGGAEHAAMAIACMRARHHRIPVVLDGYITASAVLPMHVALPGALDHCIVGHLSSEPGHRLLVEHLGMDPLLDLGMRLGEGSGAVAALPLIRMACAGVVDVPTFDEWFGS